MDYEETTVAIYAPRTDDGDFLIASVTASTIGEAMDAAHIIAEELNILGEYPVGRSDQLKDLLARQVIQEFMQTFDRGW